MAVSLEWVGVRYGKAKKPIGMPRNLSRITGAMRPAVRRKLGNIQKRITAYRITACIARRPEPAPWPP
jgi:hypothetical protein